jgi:transposase
MKIEDIDVNKTVAQARELLAKEKNISSALKSVIELLLMIIILLVNRLGLNSKNSSKPPSTDPNRKKWSKQPNSNKKAGGQPGHTGARLSKVNDPDEIEWLKLDKRTLPRDQYRDVGYEARQVFDIRISRRVIEYRAQILENTLGQQYVADFPSHVAQDVQYGAGVKVHAVYMSQFQLLPYKRVQDYFRDQMKMPLSSGTLFNFNREGYELLEKFETIVKEKLIHATLLHADETGININKKTYWLHTASNELWTHFYPHEKRGSMAMNAIGILPNFKGTLCHDHWQPYFIYECAHSLCNAHHLRELERAYEQDKQQWALAMKGLLLEMHKTTIETGGKLDKSKVDEYYKKYRAIIAEGEIECPLPEPPSPEEKKKRGRLKKSKARNLLERLSNFEKETLRFIEEVDVPFTNNLAENNIRMTKVHQKISGCFRSMEGAYIFCRIRSYLSTCQKHKIGMTEALDMLFQGHMPAFINEQI